MKLLTTIGLSITLLLASLSASATTYTLTGTFWGSQITASNLVNGDIIVVPANVSVTVKDPMTITADVAVRVYGTLSVTQNNTLLQLSAASVVSMYHTATSDATVSVGSNSTGIKVGTTTEFAANTSVSTTTTNISRPAANQGFGTPLPLKFISFNAASKGNTIALSWTAVNDGPATTFTVQQSTDGKSWTNVATVNATGDDHETVSYNYEVAAPKATSAIYRVRYEGSSEADAVYSSARMVNLGSIAGQTTAVIGAQAGRISIALNAATDRAAIAVIVTDMAGRTLHNAQYGADVTTINIPLTSNGLVAVTITDGSTFKIAQKVSVQ